MRTLFSLLLTTLLVGNSFAQDIPCKSYKTGEIISKQVPLKMMNYQTATASLSNFKKKLIILDFWSTSCIPCIRGFGKLHELQEKFKNEIDVLLVNAKHNLDTDKKIKQCFEKWSEKNKKPFLLPCVYEDTRLATMFPSLGIPHCVWISSDGIVRAITGSEEVTEENIRLILSSETATLPLKMYVDAAKPLFAVDYLPIEQMDRYSVFFKGFISGAGQGNSWEVDGYDHLLRRSYRNQPIPQIYTSIARLIEPALMVHHQLRFEVADSSRLFYTGAPKDELAWQRKNLYSFDFIAPLSDSVRFYTDVLAAMNQYSGYEGAFITRKMTCLALVRTSAVDKLKPSEPGMSTKQDVGYLKINDMPLKILTRLLNEPVGGESVAPPLMIVDETGYKGNIDIEIKAAFNDIPLLRKNLQRYDLDLKEVEREVKIFVCKED